MESRAKRRAREQMYAVSVSNYQYTLLLEARDMGGLTLKRILEIRQTTGGSLVRRELLAWDAREHLFVLTKTGERLMSMYEHAELSRKDVYRPLSNAIKNVRASELQETYDEMHELEEKIAKRQEAQERAQQRAQAQEKGGRSANA